MQVFKFLIYAVETFLKKMDKLSRKYYIIQNKIYFFGKDLETSFCLLRLGRGRLNDTL